MVAKALTAESSHEQGKAGLTACTPDEFATLQRLNAAYNEKFGFPFMLAVRGPRGDGLSKTQIIATFARRLENHPDFEFEEGLRNVHRVAELRLDDRFGHEPVLGQQAWDCAELLARHSDPGFAENGQLTVTYLTDAHRACQAQLVRWMKECGFDEVQIDAVGNVVGVYRGPPALPRAGERRSALLTGSHFDTVRNGGKYDGRLGIFVPMVCVRELHRAGRRLPFAIEVVGFAEEEGQRYKATFLGSGALIGKFDARWLDQEDADGITMREAMRHAGLPATPAAIAALQRDPADYLGFVEVHIEQGPVLTELGLPLGVVTSINGGVRFAGEVRGMASHAGTTPMATPARRRRRRRRARALPREARRRRRRTWSARWACSRCPAARSTSSPAAAASASTSAPPPTRCATRCVADVLAELHAICERRGVARQRRGDDARRRRAERARVAGALGARGRRRRAAGAPHAERRRPRRDEARRGDAAGDAVRARRELRHQPQPARIDRPPTTCSSRSRPSCTCSTSSPTEAGDEAAP